MESKDPQASYGLRVSKSSTEYMIWLYDFPNHFGLRNPLTYQAHLLGASRSLPTVMDAQFAKKMLGVGISGSTGYV